MKLVADFSKHWGLLTQTYGYKSARIKMPYKKGADFWVHVTLIVWPINTSDAFSEPPEFDFAEEDPPFYFEMKNRKLTVISPLNRPELWGTTKETGKPLLYIQRSRATRPLVDWKDSWLELQVWITSETIRPPTLPQYQEGEKNTVSGGQFESNRHRH